MLPTTHLAACDRVRDELDCLKMYLEQWPPDLAAIASQAERLETSFQQEILALSDEMLVTEVAYQWRVKQTEMHRLLRLLRTDLMFWQLEIKAGKNSRKTERIKDHLQKLQSFSCINQGS